MILGLDLSSVNSGYAVLKSKKKEEKIKTDYKVVNMKGKEYILVTYGNITPKKNLNNQAKIEIIYNMIKKLITEYDIKIVTIEDQYFGANAKTLKLLSRICGVAILAAQQNNCELYLYASTSIKKSFTGNGRAKKIDMIETAIKMLGLKPKTVDDNVADAIGTAITYIDKEVKEAD